MQVTTTTRESIAIVTLSGELDLYEAPAAKSQVLQVINAGARRLVIDLSACTYIDSSGVGLLITTLQQVRKLGGRLGLAAINSGIRQTLEYANVLRLFSEYTDCDAACADLVH